MKYNHDKYRGLSTAKTRSKYIMECTGPIILTDKDVWTGLTLIGKDCVDLDVSSAIFRNCFFMRCNFRGMVAETTNFVKTKFQDCNLDWAQIEWCTLEHCEIKGCSIKQARLWTSEVRNCAIFETNMMGTNMEHTYFEDCNVETVNFSCGYMNGAGFVHCALKKCSFQKTMMKPFLLHASVVEACDLRQTELSEFTCCNTKFADCLVNVMTKTYRIIYDEVKEDDV